MFLAVKRLETKLLTPRSTDTQSFDSNHTGKPFLEPKMKFPAGTPVVLLAPGVGGLP